MKSKLKNLKNNNKVGSVFSWAQRNSLPLLFIGSFAVLGSYLLFRSNAATGNDLVVTNVTINPASPAAGQAVTFSATIRNQGTTTVPAGVGVDVGFAIDGQTVTWNRTSTSALAAGASVTLTANAGVSGATWTATQGPHTLVATADDQNVISDENDESNNSRSIGVTIGNTGNLYLSPSSANVLIQENYAVDVRINPGTTVDGVDATLTYDATKLQFVSISATGSPFDVELGPQTGGSGTVRITRGNLSGGVGVDSLVAKVTFTALVGSGNSTVQLAGNATKAGAFTNPTTANATVNFQTPDNTPPTVIINTPTSGATVFTNMTVGVTATDAVGVTRTEVYVDGVLKGTDNSAPYSFTIDTRSLTNGQRNLEVRAYDAAGNVGTNSALINVKNWAEDINQDGKVDLLDFSTLASRFGQTGTGLGRSDINGDGKVDLLDFSLLASKFGQ